MGGKRWREERSIIKLRGRAQKETTHAIQRLSTCTQHDGLKIHWSPATQVKTTVAMTTS